MQQQLTDDQEFLSAREEGASLKKAAAAMIARSLALWKALSSSSRTRPTKSSLACLFPMKQDLEKFQLRC